MNALLLVQLLPWWILLSQLPFLHDYIRVEELAEESDIQCKSLLCVGLQIVLDSWTWSLFWTALVHSKTLSKDPCA